MVRIRSFVAAVSVVAAGIGLAGPAYADPGWSVSTAGATASGTYSIANGRAYLKGRVCDNLSDSRKAFVDLYWNQSWKGPQRAETVRTSGSGDCRDFSFNTQHTSNLQVRIGTKNFWGTYNVKATYIYR